MGKHEAEACVKERRLLSTKNLGLAFASAVGVGALQVALPSTAFAEACSTYNCWSRYGYSYRNPDKGPVHYISNRNNGHQKPSNQAQNLSGEGAVIQSCFPNQARCKTPISMGFGNKVVSHYSYVTNSLVENKAWNAGYDGYTLLWAWDEWGIS